MLDIDEMYRRIRIVAKLEVSVVVANATNTAFLEQIQDCQTKIRKEQCDINKQECKEWHPAMTVKKESTSNGR